MADFTLPLTAEGSVTAPTGVFSFVEPSAETETFLDIGPAQILELPEFGYAVADGVNPLRLITRGGVYDAGGIAPATALTAVATGTKAAATLTLTAGTNLSNNDRIDVGMWDTKVYFVSTLTPFGGGWIGTTAKVLLGSGGTGTENLAATVANLLALINGTGTYGSTYLDGYRELYGVPFAEGQGDAASGFSATSPTATTVVFTADVANAAMNAAQAEAVVGASIVSFGTGNLFTGGADGTGTAPAIGTYRYFYTWYRDADGAETGRSPITSVTNPTATNISITNLTASADTTFDYIRIYRTTDLGVEFYLVGTNPRATLTFTDDVDDETLVRGAMWNDLLHRDYTEGMPPRGRALAYWKGSLWSLGAHLAADYTKGQVSVTVDSATVTFSVKGVTTRMRGRIFQVNNTTEEYTILSVDESAGTAVLDRTYEGATNATANYTIMDRYDASAIRRSVPFLYNQWPVDESPGRVDTDDPIGGTALLATKSRLFGFSKTSIVAVTGEGPESWEISKVGQGVGCVAPRLVVGVEGGGIFLSPDGFYAISPDETLTCISSPKAPKKMLAQGIDGTVARIAWANVDLGYSYFDTTNRTVVFGLPLDNATTPNYEIVFDLQNGTWTTFKRAEWTDATPITLPDGAQAILAGDRDGYLWHDGIGASDGFYGTEAVQTLTGAQTVRTLTVTGTPFSTTGDGEKGKPVIVLYADGTTVAYGKVAANTTSALTLAEDLATAPAASDQIVLGGIAWQAKSGFTTLGEEYRTKLLRSVTIRHAPTTRGEYFLSYAVDGGSFSLPPVGTGIGSLDDANGKTKHMIQWPGDTHAIQLRGFKPGGRAVIRGGVFDVVLREVGRA